MLMLTVLAVNQDGRPLGNYRGSYSKELFMDYSHKIKKWIEQGRDVYIYFNNTMSNNALANAQLLQQLTL